MKKVIIGFAVAGVVLIAAGWYITSQPSDEQVIETPPTLVGTWVWTDTQINDGRVITPRVPGVFTIKFEEGGTLTGTTDCNTYFGSYSTGADGALKFSAIGSTKMACTGSQESEYHQYLRDVNQYVITKDGNLVLQIKFDSGSITFERQ